MLQDILLALPLGFLLAFMLGPVFFVLLETAAIKGFRAALTFNVGVIFADIIFLLIAYFSTNKLLNTIKDDPALFIFGGMILVTYGIITFIKEKKVIPHPESSEVRKLNKSDLLGLITKGFLLNFINIGVLGFWLSLIIVFGPQLNMEGPRLTIFFGSVLLTYFIIDIFKILLAKKLNHKLTPIRIFKLKRTISLIIMACGVILIFKGLFPNSTKKLEHQVEEILPGELTSREVKKEEVPSGFEPL